MLECTDNLVCVYVLKMCVYLFDYNFLFNFDVLMFPNFVLKVLENNRTIFNMYLLWFIQCYICFCQWLMNYIVVMVWIFYCETLKLLYCGIVGLNSPTILKSNIIFWMLLTYSLYFLFCKRWVYAFVINLSLHKSKFLTCQFNSVSTGSFHKMPINHRPGTRPY